MSKRTRSVNWDEEEKQLFRSILKDHAKIIEDKTLNANINKLKVKAWEEVREKFNSLNSRERDLTQLKIQWKGMKMTARKEYGTYKKDQNKTGGGPRPATPNEEIVEIKDLLNPAELLVDHNIYDSDGIVLLNPELNNSTILPKTEMILVNNNGNETYTLPALQNSTDDSVLATPLGSNKPKTNPARKLLQSKTRNISLKSQKNYNDYVDRMTAHSTGLKEKEYTRRMEMLEEKHKIEVEILKENLETAKLEHQIVKEKLKRLQ
ncbi:unnamed protein product [Euphydryas editha]|uniref:Regulatory protein zeste n=1 Tax=Euphydryas editha TaxID=104508 RepID=A0AAU9UP53_EUPED|nr:unnamed protein product [Euphydryas editha]